MARPTLHPIVRVLGGDLYAGGQRANIPGPGHGAEDRSVSLWLQGGRVVVHCFAGDDWRDVMAELRRRRLVDSHGVLAGAGSDVADRERHPTRLERTATARRLWDAARPLPGTLSEIHLALRGVAAPVQGLRHHPGVAAAVYADMGVRRPALLAAIQAADGGLTGVEVTYLAASGLRARVALSRKTIGGCPPGSAVRLARAGTRMLVGEGVFTCLSAAAVFGLPAWALLSTRNLRAWRPPAGVGFVLIAADRGRDGEASAAVLRQRLLRLGIGCAVEWPPAPFGDWNEAVVGGAVRGGEARA